MKKIIFPAAAAIVLAFSSSAKAQPLSLTSPVQSDWSSSFSYEGWSRCPQNTYLAGFHLRATIYLYHIDAVQCAGIAGAATTATTNNTTFGNTFAYPGWSWIGQHRFLSGLYRSSCNNLYCIFATSDATVIASGQQVRWASSTTASANMNTTGWHTCPAGTLLIALYRDSGSQLSNIIYFQCAYPGI